MNDASEFLRAGPPVGTFWMSDLRRQAPGSGANEVGVPRIAAGFARIDAEAEHNSIASLAEAMGFNDPGTTLERFARGRRCYAALVDGAIAAYCWVSLEEESINELGLRVRFAPGDAYIWDCATLPTYRGQGLYPALLSFIVGELRTEGLRRAWIGADTGNVASQKGFIRSGFQPIADVHMTPGSTAMPIYVRARPGIDDELVREVRRSILSDTELYES